MVLANTLQRNQTLARLGLKGNHIGDTGFRALYDAVSVRRKRRTSNHSVERPIPYRSSLTSLDVSNNGITDVGVRGMPSCVLEELYLDKNDISDIGTLDIARAIATNTHMSRLSMENNPRLTERGAHTLRAFLVSRGATLTG
jgi:Leucine-rich repeat (LRR) protein